MSRLKWVALTVINNGPSVAQNVRLTDSLPSQVTLVTPLAAGCTVNADGTITCTQATLAASASTSFQLMVTVDDDVEVGSSIENTAVV